MVMTGVTSTMYQEARLDERSGVPGWQAEIWINGEGADNLVEVQGALRAVFPHMPYDPDDIHQDLDYVWTVPIPPAVVEILRRGTDYAWTEVVDYTDTEVEDLFSVHVRP